MCILNLKERIALSIVITILLIMPFYLLKDSEDESKNYQDVFVEINENVIQPVNLATDDFKYQLKGINKLRVVGIQSEDVKDSNFTNLVNNGGYIVIPIGFENFGPNDEGKEIVSQEVILIDKEIFKI